MAVACTGVVFFAVLYRQLIEPAYRTTWYWAAVVMVSVFGTMCADVVHVGLGVPYAVSTSVFAVALVVVVVSWRGVVMAELGLVTGHVKPELFPPSVTSRCYN